MSNATDWGQWEVLINTIIKEALIELGELIKEKVVGNIDEHVYVGQNTIYEPTYEFRESWGSNDVSSGKNAEVLIKSDPSKMKWIKDLAQHGSSEDISEFLPEILAYNLSGDAMGEGWWQHRTSYMDETLKGLKANGWLSKNFKSLLRKRGLTVV